MPFGSGPKGSKDSRSLRCMKSALLSLLVDPVDRGPLALDAAESAGDEVVAGTLRARNGAVYPVESGIPRFCELDDPGQAQTRDAFAFLWKDQDSFSSDAARSTYARWLVENYGFASPEDQARYFAGRRRILDLGCGRGYASAPWLGRPEWAGEAMWVGVDISRAVDVARANLQSHPNTHFVQADALHLPFPDGCFDTIISQGVLHHTPSTRQALLSGVRTLSPGGEFLFYVYRRKGPVREFTDDYIREKIAPMSDGEALQAMRSLTRLAQVLSGLDAEVDVQEDVPLLDIRAGRQHVQRLIYWHFAKLYWNNELSFDDNVHVNFDWYRPRYAHRQSAEELRAWCAEAGLSIRRWHEQESGFTVRAIKG